MDWNGVVGRAHISSSNRTLQAQASPHRLVCHGLAEGSVHDGERSENGNLESLGVIVDGLAW